MTLRELKIGFIGAGKLATALAVGLAEAGYPVVAIAGRGLESARLLAARLPSAAACGTPQLVVNSADLIFIATPDSAIVEVADVLAVLPGQMICHVSAATPLDVLSQPASQGAITGVFHPLLSAGSPDTGTIPPGITFAVEAAEPLLTILRHMAEKLGGRMIELAVADRVMYHASAILASNYLVTLIDQAAGLWQGFATREQAVTALLPLIHSTLANVEAIGIPACLTGPVSRGDADTIQRHLTALADHAPEALSVYRTLGLATIPIALACGGITCNQAAEIKDLLETRP